MNSTPEHTNRSHRNESESTGDAALQVAFEREISQLQQLTRVPARPAAPAEHTRQQFLQEIKQLNAIPAVGPAPPQTIWQSLLHWLQSPGWVRTAMSILLALSLTFGGGWTTVFAAQQSLPGDTLYGVKILSEDVRLSINKDTHQEIELLLTFARERVLETKKIILKQGELPESLNGRLYSLVKQTIQQAASLPVAELPLALNNIQQALTQIQVELQNLQSDVDPAYLAALRLSSLILETHQQTIRSGIENPESFKEIFPSDPSQSGRSSAAFASEENPASIVSDATATAAITSAAATEPNTPPENVPTSTSTVEPSSTPAQEEEDDKDKEDKDKEDKDKEDKDKEDKDKEDKDKEDKDKEDKDKEDKDKDK